MGFFSQLFDAFVERLPMQSNDVGDLFEACSCNLNHGGRAYRRELVGQLAASWPQPMTAQRARELIEAADTVIEALTGIRPGRKINPAPPSPQGVDPFGYPDAQTEFMMGL